jgi:hypothetical protein
LTPVRIADTRSGVGGTQGPIAGEATIMMQIRGAAGVPNTATSVVLNVTAVDPQGAGYLAVFPALTARPETSSLNFDAGKNTARLVVARIGANGAMSIYFSGAQTHVIVDVTGYFVDGAGAGRFFALKPVRVTDSRIRPYLVDGQLARHTPVGPETTIDVGLIIGTSATNHWSAALVNITVTNPIARGYLTVHPPGAQRPIASSINFEPGQTVANAAIVKVGALAGGVTGISIFNSAGTDVIVDFLGYFDDGTLMPDIDRVPTAFYALDQPVRAYDTRATQALVGSETRFVNVSSAGGAPANARGVVLNATVTNSTAPHGFLSIWPAADPQPIVSSLNWVAGETVSNFVGVALIGFQWCPLCTTSLAPQAGEIAIYNDRGTADVVLDVAGYFIPVP